MTWRDKLELGLKDDAPFRRDNLPEFQKAAGGPEVRTGDATRSPEEPGAREVAADAAEIAPSAAAPCEIPSTVVPRG